jgi:DNA-binding XRE family transcriptional regulator
LTLETARKVAGFTQAEAAYRLGVSIPTLRSWEKGKAEPRVSQIKRICDLYGVQFDSIFFNY